MTAADHPLDADARRQLIIKNQRSRSVLVETGTGDATNAELLAEWFDRVITIEVAEDNYHNAIRRVTRCHNVTPLFGNSNVLLPYVIDNLIEGGLGDDGDLGIVFFLDAHDNGHTAEWVDNPLLEELEHILYRRPKNSLILVDDMHLVGREGFPTLAQIGDTIHKYGFEYTITDAVLMVVLP